MCKSRYPPIKARALPMPSSLSDTFCVENRYYVPCIVCANHVTLDITAVLQTDVLCSLVTNVYKSPARPSQWWNVIG